MSFTREQQVAQHRQSLENKEKYWEEAAGKLVWTKKWDKVLDDSKVPFAKWFVGGEMNICFNCVDRHVQEGFGERTTFIFDSPVTNTHRKYTFNETLEKVSKVGGVLTSLGIKKGDVVLIYMPMIPEGAFAMLGTTRIGAMHACVPSGLPAKDLAERIDHCKPKVIIAATYGYHATGWMNYKVEIDAAYDMAEHKPEHIIIFQRVHMDPLPLKTTRDLDWNAEMSKASPVGCVPVEATEPAFMVYTSGSTGAPKGVVHSGASYQVRNMQDGPNLVGGDDGVVFGTSNYGWIAGHGSVYGTTTVKTATILYEGDPILSEDVRALYQVLSRNKVTRALIRPGILNIIKGMDPDGKVASEFCFDSLQLFYVAGERSDADTMKWALQIFQASIWNMWAQSEIVGAICGLPSTSLEQANPTFNNAGMIAPGFDVFIMSRDGVEAKPNQVGRILLRLPLPPGAFVTLFEDEEQFKSSYFSTYPGFYDTKDEGFKDENGLLTIENRADDMMKVGLYYLSAQAVEEVIMKHKAVSECVVVSKTDLVWKEIPVVLYVKRPDCDDPVHEINTELGEMLLEKFGASVNFGPRIHVKELPKTRTGKLHRSSCISIVRGTEIKGEGALENSHVLQEIVSAVETSGI